MKRINIIIGRFQPFTKGHMKCVLEAWNKLKVPTVVVMIDTPDDKVDEKHPFLSSLTLPLYNTLFEDYKEIEGVILSKNANIVTIGEQLYNMGYEICCWTCGTDRYDSYEKMAFKYKDKAHLSDDFQLLEIKRSDEDISATKVRECLLRRLRVYVLLVLNLLKPRFLKKTARSGLKKNALIMASLKILIGAMQRFITWWMHMTLSVLHWTIL